MIDDKILLLLTINSVTLLCSVLFLIPFLVRVAHKINLIEDDIRWLVCELSSSDDSDDLELSSQDNDEDIEDNGQDNDENIEDNGQDNDEDIKDNGQDNDEDIEDNGQDNDEDIEDNDEKSQNNKTNHPVISQEQAIDHLKIDTIVNFLNKKPAVLTADQQNFSKIVSKLDSLPETKKSNVVNISENIQPIVAVNQSKKFPTKLFIDKLSDTNISDEDIADLITILNSIGNKVMVDPNFADKYYKNCTENFLAPFKQTTSVLSNVIKKLNKNFPLPTITLKINSNDDITQALSFIGNKPSISVGDVSETKINENDDDIKQALSLINNFSIKDDNDIPNNTTE